MNLKYFLDDVELQEGKIIKIACNDDFCGYKNVIGRIKSYGTIDVTLDVSGKYNSKIKRILYSDIIDVQEVE